VSGQHHKSRVGWVYGPRPRGTCTGCHQSKVIDTHGLVVAHRNPDAPTRRCPGSNDPPEESAMPEPDQAPEPVPPSTYMAQFVTAAQTFTASVATVRAAMSEAMRAFNGLHTAMQQAGLLDGPGLCDGCDRTDQPVTATDDGRALLCPDCTRVGSLPVEPQRTPALQQLDTDWARPSESCPTCWPRACDPNRSECHRHTPTPEETTAVLAQALDIPSEAITGPSPDGLPDHWTGAAPITGAYMSPFRTPADPPHTHQPGCRHHGPDPGRGPIQYPHRVPRTQEDIYGPVPTQTQPNAPQPEPERGDETS